MIIYFIYCIVVLQGWPMYAQLLIDLFKYLAPFLRNVELNKPMQILYKVCILFNALSYKFSVTVIVEIRIF